jgi:hypothetical protein
VQASAITVSIAFNVLTFGRLLILTFGGGGVAVYMGGVYHVPRCVLVSR